MDNLSKKMEYLKLLSVYIMSLTIVGCTSDNSYICTGPQSEVYHRTEDCAGLSKCSGVIKSITISKAEKIGRRPCKICLK